MAHDVGWNNKNNHATSTPHSHADIHSTDYIYTVPLLYRWTSERLPETRSRWCEGGLLELMKSTTRLIANRCYGSPDLCAKQDIARRQIMLRSNTRVYLRYIDWLKTPTYCLSFGEIVYEINTRLLTVVLLLSKTMCWVARALCHCVTRPQNIVNI